MINSRTIRSLLGMILIVATICHAARLYFDMPTNSLDGAFQTFNAVSAYSRGESLGNDFQSYLGAVMPLAIVPLFLVLGKTVYAATFSAILLCCAGYYLTILVLLRLTTRLSRNETALWAMAATFLAFGGIKLTDRLLLPGVSLKPLRFALPFLLALPMWALLNRVHARTIHRQSPLLPSALLGSLIAGASLWSNDAGIPCLIAAISVHALLCFRTMGFVPAFTSLAVFLASVVITASIVILLLTQGAPAAWVHYTFVAIPTDQPWFFPPWSPDMRVLAIGDIFNILRTPTGWTIAICGVTACIAIYRLWTGLGEAVPTAMIAFIYAATTGIGLLPQIGGHIDVEYGIGTVIPALFAPLWLLPRLGIGTTKLLSSRWQVHITCALAVLALAAIGASIHTRLKREHTYSPTIGAYVEPSEAEAIAVIARAQPMIAGISPDPKGRILSTYYSALSIAAQAASPTPHASIIHVLGDDARRDYAVELRDTNFALVTTINPEFSGWAGWNLRASWFAMKTIVERYEPFARSSQHIFWKRRVTPLPPPTALSCFMRPLGNGGAELTISDTGGTISPQGVWLTDIDVRSKEAAGLYWIANDVVSPAEKARINKMKQGWIDFPNYGLPPQNRLGLVAEYVAGDPLRIRLRAIPNPSAAISGRCTATRFAPMPSVRDLPVLNDRILHEALAPRLSRS